MKHTLNILFMLTLSSFTPYGSRAQSIIPLSVGNEWSYRFQFFDTSGALVRQDTMHLMVFRDTMISNEKWFLLRMVAPFAIPIPSSRSVRPPLSRVLDCFPFNESNLPLHSSNSLSDTTDIGFFANRPNGLYRFFEGEPFLQFKYPGTAGESYRSFSDSVTILSTDSTANVVSGTYSCYLYELRPISDSSLQSGGYQKGQIYLAPGISDVEETYYGRTSTNNVYRIQDNQLVSYSLVTHVHEPPIIITEPHLAQNYPNPFNPSTTIRFTLARSAHVSITIYNMVGEAVATLLNAPTDFGTHDVSWNASGNPTGIYLCRLQAGSFADMRKLILLK